MDQDLIAKYEGRRVPRYTSYPTAPHFNATVGEGAYREWLAALPPGTALSLYLHVPFCRSMCWYCGCHTKVTRRNEPVDAYLAALRREVELVAAVLPATMPVVHLHWGGGTPTILAPADFAETMELIRRRFAVAEDAEIAVEIDPRRLTRDMIAALGGAGVTRASLGVQTFDPLVQKAINRIQSFEQTRAVVDGLRAAGIDRINLDLLYGLPHQTVAACEETVARALELAPDRLAVFGYAHVPWMKTHQRMIDEAVLPDGPARLAQFEAIAGRLLAAGHRQVGLDHFARPGDPLAIALEAGTLRRNFQGYTTDRAAVLIGFGASAIGALPSGYVQNVAATGEYERRIAAGRLAVGRGIALTPDDRLRRDLIERIMCVQRVDLAAVCRRHGVLPGALADAMPALQALARDGVIRIDGTVVTVKPGCRPLLRNVAAAFDRYLQPAETRHARAV